MFDLVFTRRYSMGHRLIHGAGDICATPHGHNEEVSVYLKAHEAERLDGSANMVLPFYYAKKKWHQFVDGSIDHSFQLSEDDPLLPWFIKNEPKRVRHLVVTPGDPTTELMACLLMIKVNTILDAEKTSLYCFKIDIKETPTNTVSFSGNPFDFVPQSKNGQGHWWERPDMSISDLEV
ncbi:MULTISPECIES: 6-carboxytetrahydropterin synthase [unclassified Commensalibacter]|uniref:6-pyruvoyl trahydropterin synthase family protein n=1 Tax=unclassified Commensalibacter TaxID=2630218 RepID=UPI0018DB4730|nr:6-carboxytetrahydropterin synthase [Commensalibacter sp. M0265]MBH9977644.1 6-carboxytetrahydropterin synthase [Commensalibacter sp. M0266]MBH9993205.1 6-carboxytetrahydropterin synthase [Commensalibacter sp. M0270]MBI0046820.1 6-carboxytetrahydropterin synthase [Commensalibacter sp. M0267]MBI0056370.1 6-carboxytetrahydropterin synthase [Commensalibacter sp. M0268]